MMGTQRLDFRKVLILFSLLVGLLACNWSISLGPFTLAPYSPPDEVEIESLLIDISAFPKGWVMSDDGATPPGKAPLGGNRASAGISLGFYSVNGVATEAIFLYRDFEKASEEFERQTPIRFPVNEFWTEWKIPDGLEFQSAKADRYMVACAIKEREHCQMIAQYGIYFVRFGSHILPTMTYEEFSNVLEAIDARMVQFLEKP